MTVAIFRKSAGSTNRMRRIIILSILSIRFSLPKKNQQLFPHTLFNSIALDNQTMSASSPPPISTRTVRKGVPYGLDVWLRRNDKVEASFWRDKENDDNDGELIGYIQGYLLERPSGDFYMYFLKESQMNSEFSA